MLIKPLHIITFLFSAFLVLAFTVGVTQAASQLLMRDAKWNGNSVALAEIGSTVEPSPTNLPSMTPEPTREKTSKVEFSGVWAAVNLEWWTIGDYVVLVTADTEIEGQPVVGDSVWVEAVLQPDGTYIAHEISSHSGRMEDDDSQNGLSMKTPDAPEMDDTSSGQGNHSGAQEWHDDEHKQDDHHIKSGSGFGDGDRNEGGSPERGGDD